MEVPSKPVRSRGAVPPAGRCARPSVPACGGDVVYGRAVPSCVLLPLPSFLLGLVRIAAAVGAAGEVSAEDHGVAAVGEPAGEG